MNITVSALHTEVAQIKADLKKLNKRDKHIKGQRG